MIRAPRASATAASTAIAAAATYAAPPPSPGAARRSARARRRWRPRRSPRRGGSWRRPRASFAARRCGLRARSSPPSRTRTATRCRSPRPPARQRPGPARSTRHLRLVVHDAEDLAAAVAVAGQGGVTVDPGVGVAAAVGELAHVPVAAAVPGTVQLALEAVEVAGLLADPRSRRRRQRTAVGVAQPLAVLGRPGARRRRSGGRGCRSGVRRFAAGTPCGRSAAGRGA